VELIISIDVKENREELSLPKSIDAASRNTVQSSHPFRVIDNDELSIHSMQSLGRVGRILSGSLDPASINVKEAQKDSQTCHESPTAPVNDSPQTTSEPQKFEDNLSQNSNYSVTMKPGPILQKPDVIASTKLAHSKTSNSVN
jgi:WD repeat-containing protein 44